MALTTRARAAFALGAILALVSLASGADARETSPEIRLSEGAARRLLAAHQYRMRDKVPLYANKAGPFHNPSEVRRERHGGAFPAERNAAMIDWDGWPMPTNTPVARL